MAKKSKTPKSTKAKPQRKLRLKFEKVETPERPVGEAPEQIKQMAKERNTKELSSIWDEDLCE